MALTCSTTVVSYETFEFIDCSTINVNYDVRGIATVSFAVVTTRSTLLNDYTNMELGGVRYKLHIRDVQVSKLPGTLVNVFQLNLEGFGC